MGKKHVHTNLSSARKLFKIMKSFFEPSSKKFNVAARTSVEKNTRKNLVHPHPDGDLNKKKKMIKITGEKHIHKNLSSSTSSQKT